MQRYRRGEASEEIINSVGACKRFCLIKFVVHWVFGGVGGGFWVVSRTLTAGGRVGLALPIIKHARIGSNGLVFISNMALLILHCQRYAHCKKKKKHTHPLPLEPPSCETLWQKLCRSPSGKGILLYF